MANEHKMIDPFTESQIRKNGDQELISYGTSSFGYDVRCANEFKVFTNINSAVVDPKNFDESSFVNLESDIVSFLLIHSHWPEPSNILESQEMF